MESPTAGKTTTYGQKLFVQYDLFEFSHTVEVHVWVHVLNYQQPQLPHKRVITEQIIEGRDTREKSVSQARIAAMTRAHIWVMEIGS